MATKTKVSGADVEQQIALVNREYAAAEIGLSGASGSWVYTLAMTTAPSERALGQLRQLRPRIDEWTKQGRDAIRSGKPPPIYTTGWQGWAAKGNTLLEGVHLQFDTGTKENVRILEETVADVARDVKRLPAQVAETAAPLAWGVGLPIFLGAGAVLALIVIGKKAVL